MLIMNHKKLGKIQYGDVIITLYVNVFQFLVYCSTYSTLESRLM